MAAVVVSLSRRSADAALDPRSTSDLQEIVDGWQIEGQAPSTIRNSLKPPGPLPAARTREGVPLNPTHDLELPWPEPSEVEILAPEVAAQLLGALTLEDRVIWATAPYAGRAFDTGSSER